MPRSRSTTGGQRVHARDRADDLGALRADGSSDPVPAAPTQLTAHGYFNGVEFRIDLAWTDNATNEFYYAIERCAGAGCSNFVEIGRALGENATGFRDAPLTSGATYTYRVRAIGFTGNSGYSNTATAIDNGHRPRPAAPSNLVAAFSGNAVQLSWIDNAVDETQFAIERCAGVACSAFTQISGGRRQRHQLPGHCRRRRAELLVSRPGVEIGCVFGLLQRGERDHAAGPADRADEPGRELEHPAPDQPHVGQHRHQRDVDHRAALHREHVHRVCRRRADRRDCDVLDRLRE